MSIIVIVVSNTCPVPLAGLVSHLGNILAIAAENQ
jgi:hypothetical protein